MRQSCDGEPSDQARPRSILPAMPVADLFPDLFESFTRTAHFPEKTIRAVEQLLTEKNGKAYLKCQVRGKEIMAKPEEITRQLWLHLLLTKYKYPASRL